MKTLLISHAHPPTVGGIENQNYELSYWLSKITDLQTLANRKGKKFLPIFMVFAFFQGLFLQYDIILLGSAVLSPIGWLLKVIRRKPVISIVHGLDLTFQNRLYQLVWVKFCTTRLDKIIAVGRETLRIAEEKGVSKEKLVFIPNGVNVHRHAGKFSRIDLGILLGQKLENKKVLLTSGRLVKRKGVAWFIRNVLVRLPKNILYVIAGDGPDQKNVLDAIRILPDRVQWLGYVTDPIRDILFHTCDVFVQPNIKIEGDTEGFGISVIEAAFCRIPVLASRLEGLQDAIQEGKNGFLVESKNPEAWVEKILQTLSIPNFRTEQGEEFRNFIIANYRWEKIAEIYRAEIEKVHISNSTQSR
ncbi:Glycosyl transferase, group 1 family [Gammaproteobacteria bacterium]